jgi:hypothetical protein
MSRRSAVSLLFVVAALYDGLLGIVFLLAGPRMYTWFEVAPPNHFGYVHFPAALLIVFALMFAAIAKNPMANRNLIPYGILLKVTYCAVVFFHWFNAGLPNMWKPFAFIDLVFLVFFVWAYLALGKVTSGADPERESDLQPAR